jgi:hypothetical protein
MMDKIHLCELVLHAEKESLFWRYAKNMQIGQKALVNNKGDCKIIKIIINVKKGDRRTINVNCKKQ